jgi:hypothetical protein
MDLDAGAERRGRAALVHAGGRLRGVEQPGRHQALGEFEVRDHLGPRQLRELGHVVGVIAMAMGEQNQVDLAEGREVLVLGGRARIGREEGIDDDHLASHARDAERGVAKIQHSIGCADAIAASVHSASAAMILRAIVMRRPTGFSASIRKHESSSTRISDPDGAPSIGYIARFELVAELSQ